MKHRGRRKEVSGFVYIIQAQQWFKIGRTWNLSRRLAQLAVTPPFPTSMIHAFGCDNVREAEELLHQIHADVRVSGEWFRLGRENVDFLLKVCKFRNSKFVIGDQCRNLAVWMEGYRAAQVTISGCGIPISNPFDPAYPCYGIWQSGYDQYGEDLDTATITQAEEYQEEKKMPTKMKDLSLVMQAIPIYTLHVNGHIVLIDGEKTSLGFDIVPIFSTPVRAQQYAASFPSLQDATIERTQIARMVEHFNDRVEYFILDRSPYQPQGG